MSLDAIIDFFFYHHDRMPPSILRFIEYICSVIYMHDISIIDKSKFFLKECIENFGEIKICIWNIESRETLPIEQCMYQNVFLSQNEREVGTILSRRGGFAQNDDRHGQSIYVVATQTGECIHIQKIFIFSDGIEKFITLQTYITIMPLLVGFYEGVGGE